MGRMETFTQRAVNSREHLYEPPVNDNDHGASWDYIAAICWAFAAAGILFLIATAALVIG